MFSAYSSHTVDLGPVRLHLRSGGSGPVLLLLHGHPQSHVMWHRVADTLARHFTVVAMDLPGYGDSSRPPADEAHENHSKRRMAAQVHAAMCRLGWPRYDVCAHDRGARVAHRLAMDTPDAVRRLMLLDIAPTLAMYEGTGEDFARSYWHWFFLVQPAPLPERLIEADPVFYLRSVIGRRHAGLAAFDAVALAEYERCIAVPGSATSICEDYRASAAIDLVHDREDVAQGRRLEQPLRVLWGAQGVVARCFDVMSLWRERAAMVSGRSLDGGHYIAEEQPDALVKEMLEFFVQGVK
ncbi:alpha/beta hydrolase [Aquabacterium sp. A7-Y]|uniref:alpha/beta fold hydrolase n=1 Tax=Aquabacterium sp. A7-Y TaxID=1349605 RepID=UPI00223D9662|nr:alpha/beta hydrolase [Aquabacterium sp. A7-Y]MCW7541603.1 alpha/beta hydrolase [Aquabacterium sp. A7-Y]